MEHPDHVRLLQAAVPPGGVWAEFGSGCGAFTLALADLAGPAARIVSVDRDRRALVRQLRELAPRFPEVMLTVIGADFTLPLTLPPLDGLLMANSLHFVRDKLDLLPLLRGYLKPDGRFVLVEYDTDSGNHWVPYPLSYRTWERLAAESGLQQTRLLATQPSRFLGRIYSALSMSPAS